MVNFGLFHFSEPFDPGDRDRQMRRHILELMFAIKMQTIQAKRHATTKPMRLPEIFGLSTFLVFWVSRYFDVQNKSGTITLVSEVQKFCEAYQKSYQKSLPKILPKNNHYNAQPSFRLHI